jgi:hypothetical protein
VKYHDYVSVYYYPSTLVNSIAALPVIKALWHNGKMVENLAHRTREYLRDAKVSLGVCALMAFSNIFVDRQDMMVYANDPLTRQALLAFPSALPTPEVTGNPAADLAIQCASTALTTEIARRSSTSRQLIGTAITAQAVSCGVDALVERTGWLSVFERSQPDVGFSAISAAWFGKLFLDRAQRAKTPLRRNLWRAGLAVYGGTITAGYYFLNGAEGGKLDLTSHAAGLVVGVAAHFIGQRKSNMLHPELIADES